VHMCRKFNAGGVMHCILPFTFLHSQVLKGSRMLAGRLSLCQNTLIGVYPPPLHGQKSKVTVQASEYGS